MSGSALRIVVTGLIARYPFGGVTWDYVQWVAGLARLGHDVYYLEDTGQWPYNPESAGLSGDASYNLRHLESAMARFGLEERWCVRFPWEDGWTGLSEARRTEMLDSADLLINVSGTLADPWAYRSIPRLAYVDTDPAFTQLKLARGQEDFRRQVDLHDVHFSFGEAAMETLPDTGHTWLPVRQPIVLDEWRGGVPTRPDTFTTVMNWSSYNTVTFEGRELGQKDVELRRLIDLPSRVPDVQLEIALNPGKKPRAPIELLEHAGWTIVDPMVCCADIDDYRAYIRDSFAEWSVAKNGYVEGGPGWFSCRSACYLAAGSPVVVQDTGLAGILPTEEGIVTFTDLDDAVAAIEEVRGDRTRHSRAASEIAESYFDSDMVLGRLLEDSYADAALETRPS